MNLVKVQVAELSGWALNYAVARAVGYHVDLEEDPCGPDYYLVMGREDMYLTRDPAEFYVWSPSTDWGQAGPLIERYPMQLMPNECSSGPAWLAWIKCAEPDEHMTLGFNGDTPLIAACRAIVAAKLGEVVSVPAELMEVNPCEKS